MTLIYLRPDDQIYIQPHDELYLHSFGPNWIKLNSFDQIVDVSPIEPGLAFETSHIYSSIRMVFADGHPWQDTLFYEYTAEAIERGNELWGCRTREDLLDRLNTDIPKLFHSIKSFGFLTQERIGQILKGENADERLKALLQHFARDEYPSRVTPQHEIKVGINERGKLIFLDGRHRLAIGRIQGIKDIPARVVFRHRDMVRMKNILQKAAETSQGDAPLYRNSNPDLWHLGLSAEAVESASRPLRDAGLTIPEFEPWTGAHEETAQHRLGHGSGPDRD